VRFTAPFWDGALNRTLQTGEISAIFCGFPPTFSFGRCINVRMVCRPRSALANKPNAPAAG
jgi:hypothetical protein